jgi:hypothetical protein
MNTNLSTDTQCQRTITLAEIAHRKAQVKQEICEQKKQITLTAGNLLSPLASVGSSANALIKKFNTGVAIFDGVMLGFRIIKKIRKLF